MTWNSPYPRRYGRFDRYGSRARRTDYAGRSYASQAEAQRAVELEARRKCGDVLQVTAQPTVCLGCPENIYRPDFHVVMAGGDEHYEDVKGAATEAFRRHVRLWRVYGPAPLWILRRHRSGKWTPEIIPAGPKRKTVAEDAE